MDHEVPGRPSHGTSRHSDAVTLTQTARLGHLSAPAADAPAAAPPLRISPRAAWQRLSARPGARQVAVLCAYLAAGVAVTWPRATYLGGLLPATRDAGGYVWGFWWVAHQVVHLGNPWSTTYLAAPVGTQLGFHTLMPLPGLVLAPVTLAFGPSFSYNLLSVACPGLLAYAMYRAARLWLPDGPGAYAAGALFGLSAILSWRSWYEVNLAAGALFFPLALEAAVRLRRTPRVRQAVILGVVLGASALTDQESAVMTALLAALVLLPWLCYHPALRKLGAAALAALAAAIVASPQILAMAQQAANGGAATAPHILATDYAFSGAGLEQLFSPSPRLAGYGLTALARPYYNGGPLNMVVVGYGVALTGLALLGLIVARRRRSAWLLGALWLGCTALSLGSSLWVGHHRYLPLAGTWAGERLSLLMPFTWFVRLPGLSNFREADRFTELALVGAALLAGAGAGWLYRHSRPALAAAAAVAVLEAGWAGNPATVGLGAIATMRTSMPALTRPIAADHSNSVVVAVPFGIRGGLPVLGWAFPPQTLVMATAEAHPLGDAFISRIPSATRREIKRIPFYAGLIRAQDGFAPKTPAAKYAAWQSARHTRIGWIVDWMWRNRAVSAFLRASGFRLAYRADGAWVFRLAHQPAPGGWITAVRISRHRRSTTADRSGSEQVNGRAKRVGKRPPRYR